MRIAGLLIAVALVSMLFVWWLNLSLKRTNEAVNTVQQIDESQGTQTQPGVGPVDHSRQKVDEFNELNRNRSEEMIDLP